MRAILVILAIVGASVLGPVAHGETTTRELGDLSKVGQVSFPTSCDPSVQAEFERGVALLHSFFYSEARRVFTEVAGKDPECAMAWWGVAMTYYHPIWTAPDSSELAAGLSAVERALAASKQDDRERAYVRAVEAFYKGVDAPADSAMGAPSCHAPSMMDARGRAACFRREMEQVSGRWPDDLDANAFFALSLLGTAPPADPTLANQKQSAEILEKWYAKRKDHPGLAHYLIHSYDYPALANKGLPAANAYAAMQPWVPHALHMPSHIYTRLGMWPENIESNLASADASRLYAAKHHPDAASFEELHALDYLIYGYLQTAQDAKAKGVLDRLKTIKKTVPETDFAVAYAFGAIPARHALERRQWREAAKLEKPPMPFWSRLSFAEGHLVYARTVGAVRSGDQTEAKAGAKRLGELSNALVDPRFRYFKDQMELQRQAALGLIALGQGDTTEALNLLRRAAAREDSLGKHPVSPGSILPIRELLGEALLDCGQPAEALTEFEASLVVNPGRLNGLVGAARAADRAGRADAARRYYGQVSALADIGDGTRAEVTEAREYLKAQ